MEEAIRDFGSPPPPAAHTAPEDEVSAVTAEIVPNVSDLVLEAMKPQESGQLCVAPAFNEKKLANAMKTYLRLDANEQLLVLFDDTFWGAAKQGFAMTDHRLIWNDGGKETRQVVYSEIRDVCHEHNVVLFILSHDRFQGFSMDLLDKEVAGALDVLFSRLADLNQKYQVGSTDDYEIRFLRTGMVLLTEVDGEEIESVKGLLCLTNRELIWMDVDSNQFGLSLYDVNTCWKTLIGQTFWVKRHTRKPGLLGSMGIGGRAEFGWKARGDAKRWVEAIHEAVARLPSPET